MKVLSLFDGISGAEGVSQAQRCKSLGNSFTVPVIKHILSFIKQTN